MQAVFEVNFLGWRWVAGLYENKANSASPAGAGARAGQSLAKKDIEERKKMEKALGLDKLADNLGKTSKGFMNDLDLMYSSDEFD